MKYSLFFLLTISLLHSKAQDSTIAVAQTSTTEANSGEWDKYDKAKGKEIFSVQCASCHYVFASEGKGIGPALNGASKRAPNREWFYKWIKNSQALIATGDVYANKIWNDYKPVQMTAFGSLSPNEIDNILAYVETAVEPAPIVANTGAAGGQVEEKQGAGYYVMLFLAIALIIGMILMLLNVISTIYKSKGIKLFEWNTINGLLFVIIFVVGFAWIFYQFAAYNRYLLPESASEHGVITDNMLMVTLVLTFVVFILTHGLLFINLFIHRYKKDKKASYHHDNKKLEFFWTLIPAIVLTALVLFGSKTWLEITSKDEKELNEALEIEVYAYQFGWNFRYSGADNELGKHNYLLVNKDYESFKNFEAGNNFLGVSLEDEKGFDDQTTTELWLPKGKPVLLKFRSQDVIHSAYLPHFRVQMNVVPGMPTQFYFVPTITTEEMRKKTGEYNFEYILLCNKICGGAHYNMKRIVKVVEYDEWVKWMAEQKPYFATKANGTTTISDSTGISEAISIDNSSNKIKTLK